MLWKSPAERRSWFKMYYTQAPMFLDGIQRSDQVRVTNATGASANVQGSVIETYVRRRGNLIDKAVGQIASIAAKDPNVLRLCERYRAVDVFQ